MPSGRTNGRSLPCGETISFGTRRTRWATTSSYPGSRVSAAECSRRRVGRSHRSPRLLRLHSLGPERTRELAYLARSPWGRRHPKIRHRVSPRRERRERQHQERQHQERQRREPQRREPQRRELQRRELQRRELQHREPQRRELQRRELQRRELQRRELQRRELQRRACRRRDWKLAAARAPRGSSGRRKRARHPRRDLPGGSRRRGEEWPGWTIPPPDTQAKRARRACAWLHPAIAVDRDR